MNHFPPSEWVDFVRGTALPETRAGLERHLASGCDECRSALALWSRVSDLAKTELTYTPPAGVVQAVKASFQPAVKESSVWSAFAELVFDSSAQPAFAGVRSAATGTRRLLYRSGHHSVDLSIEAVSDTELSVIGQVLDSAARSAEVAGVKVRLIQGGMVLATAETNDAGVFHLRCGEAGGFEIALKLEAEAKDLVLTVSPGKLGWRE